MSVGEKVLVLLPTASNKLLMQWKGPFTIVEKVEKVDYKIDIGGKLKISSPTCLNYMLKERVILTFEALQV